MTTSIRQEYCFLYHSQRGSLLSSLCEEWSQEVLTLDIRAHKSIPSIAPTSINIILGVCCISYLSFTSFYCVCMCLYICKREREREKIFSHCHKISSWSQINKLVVSQSGKKPLNWSKLPSVANHILLQLLCISQLIHEKNTRHVKRKIATTYYSCF